MRNVVFEVVVLEARRGGEDLLAVLGVVLLQRGDVAVRERGTRQVELEIARAGGHVPESVFAGLPPVLADGPLKVFEALFGKLDRREELAGEAAAEVLRDAVGLLADLHHRLGVDLLVVLPEVRVVLRLQRLRDEARAVHVEEHLAVLALQRLALFDVGKEVFGRLASVLHILAEEGVPVFEDVEEVVLGNRLLVEQVEKGHLGEEILPALRDELLVLRRLRKVIDMWERDCRFSQSDFICQSYGDILDKVGAWR